MKLDIAVALGTNSITGSLSAKSPISLLWAFLGGAPDMVFAGIPIERLKVRKRLLSCDPSSAVQNLLWRNI